LRAVIFDLGGVLVSYEHLKTLAAVGKLCTTEAEVLNALFHEVSEPFGMGTLDAAGFHQFYVERAAMHENLEKFIEAFCAGLGRNEPALAYAAELQTRPGVTVGVISNTNEAHVYWLDEYLPELKTFDLVVMSNEVGIVKPDAAIYQIALDELGVEAADALFVDDLAVNIQGAQAVGMKGIVHTDWAITKPLIEKWLATGELG